MMDFRDWTVHFMFKQDWETYYFILNTLIWIRKSYFFGRIKQNYCTFNHYILCIKDPGIIRTVICKLIITVLGGITLVLFSLPLLLNSSVKSLTTEMHDKITIYWLLTNPLKMWKNSHIWDMSNKSKLHLQRNYTFVHSNLCFKIHDGKTELNGNIHSSIIS
jgi:hypothetical protein